MLSEVRHDGGWNHIISVLKGRVLKTFKGSETDPVVLHPDSSEMVFRKTVA